METKEEIESSDVIRVVRRYEGEPSGETGGEKYDIGLSLTERDALKHHWNVTSYTNKNAHLSCMHGNPLRINAW